MSELLMMAAPLVGGAISGYGTSQGNKIAAGYAAQAADNAKTNLATTTGYYKPYMDTGTAANTQMADLQGLNGTAAQTAAAGQFQTDPGWAASSKYAQQQLLAKQNASGQGMGANTMAALNDLNTKNMADAYDKYYNRLSGLQQAGLGATGQLSNFTAQNENTVGSALTNEGSYLGNAEAAPYQGIGSGLMGSATIAAGLYGANGGMQGGRGLGSLFGNSNNFGTPATSGYTPSISSGLPKAAGTSIGYGV
jgi:hypothetical protein